MKSLLPLMRVLLFALLISVVRAASVNEVGITTTVVFLAPDGFSTTDVSGITYNYGGASTFEPKVYPEQFWGTFPLYLPGTTMRFTVFLTNDTAQGKRPYNVKVQAISNVLNETINGGGLGTEIGTSETWEVTDLLPGQTRTVTGSVVIPGDGSLPSGLDVTRIIISHLNNANDPDEDDTVAGFVDLEYCAWCPPPRVTLASQNSSASRLAGQWRSELTGFTQLVPSITSSEMDGANCGEYPREADRDMQSTNEKFAHRAVRKIVRLVRQNQPLSG
jgi:hypothetical protein